MGETTVKENDLEKRRKRTVQERRKSLEGYAFEWRVGLHREQGQSITAGERQAVSWE